MDKEDDKNKAEAKGNIQELIKVLVGCKKEIGDGWERFNNSLDEKDQAQAWIELVQLLHICGSGLKICKSFLPNIKKNLELRGIKVKDVDQILEEGIPESPKSEGGASESKKKSYKKIIVIPHKQNIH
jgi:hypothetical protein